MKKCLLLCLVCLTPILMFATKVGVLHLKAVNIMPGTAETVANLIASELINYGHQVLDPDAMDAAVGKEIKCYESECAADAGYTAKVERVLFGSVSRLGEKHIVQITVVNVSTREIIWSGNLAAKTADDLDVVAKRMAKSIAEGKKTSETVEVEMITQEEGKEPMRRKSFHTTGIRCGGLVPLGGFADSDFLYHLGAVYWYETPNFAVELGFYYAFSGDLGITEGGHAYELIAPELSLLYLMSKSDVSPYIGGGIGFGVIGLFPEGDFDVGSGYGVSLNCGGGVVFLRTYDIRLLLDVRYRVNLAQVSGFDGSDPRLEGPHHGLMFSIGFTYVPKFKGCFGLGCL